MKKNEKQMIGILILVAVVIIAIIFFATRSKKEENKGAEIQNTVKEEFVQVLEDGTKLNVSSKLNEAKTVNGLKIQNIQLTDRNGQSVLLADVTNESGKDTDILSIDIILYDKTGKELGKVPGMLAPMKAGATSQLNAGITEDYANAYDFKVVIQ